MANIVLQQPELTMNVKCFCKRSEPCNSKSHTNSREYIPPNAPLHFTIDQNMLIT